MPSNFRIKFLAPSFYIYLLIIRHLQWTIAFLLLLHKLDIPTLKTWEYLFWNTNSTCVIVVFFSKIAQIALCIVKELKYIICIWRALLWCCWLRLNTSTNLSSHCKMLKYIFCNGKLPLCCCWLRLNNSTIRISHCKTPKNMSSAMEYRLCAVVESDSTTAQIVLSIAKYLEIHLMQWQIPLVFLLILTQQYHKYELSMKTTRN